MDMSKVIIPKSDQINADDLIAGPRTIRIRDVQIKAGEQPVSIFFDGDDGKPYKCCKSMARVLVAAWGADAKQYIGRSLTLYRDPNVKWAGMAVGGIRISHMSHIKGKLVMALTETKGSRKPFTVLPLEVQQQAQEQQQAAQTTQQTGAKGPTVRERFDQAKAEIAKCQFRAELTGWKEKNAELLEWLQANKPAAHDEIMQAIDEADARISEAA
jgi:hypothetical protein